MRLKPTLREPKLQQSTARDFGMGLNVVDSEFNLTSKFAVAGWNMVPDDNGALQVRWGTRLFADFTSVLSGRIVGIEYYFTYVIAVDSNGDIAASDAAGGVSLIWSQSIANALSGNPSGWSATASVSFAQFLGELIIANGVDKPLLVTNDLSVRYLQDVASGSNFNTPVCRFVTTHSNYTVMAGDPNFPGRIYISQSGTSGTWPGDGLPNDAIIFDADKYASDTIGEITGIASYRDKLIVFFSTYVLSLTLGKYNTASPPVHSPEVADTIASYGAVSHRAIVSANDLLIFLDYTGVSSIKRSALTAGNIPSRLSHLIDVDIQRDLSRLSRGYAQDNCFAVYDRRENRVMFFIPTIEDSDPQHTYAVYTVSIQRNGKTYAWSKYRNWKFQAGSVSVEGRVFLANDRMLYRHGSRFEPILSDYEGVAAYDGAASDKVGVYVNGVYCDADNLATGIDFYHELPNNELRDRTSWKSIHYITMDTQGASPFTVQLYLDDLKKRPSVTSGEAFSDGTLFTDGYGWLPLTYEPYASMTFIGGDRGAEGVVLPEQETPYRPTDNMGLYAIYARFRFFKMAFTGKSHSHLRIVSVSLYYTAGSIY